MGAAGVTGVQTCALPIFFFSSRRRHTRCLSDWSSDVCSSDLYVPYLQAPSRSMDIGIRSTGDPLRLAHAAIAAVRSVDSEEPVSDVRSMDRLIRNNAIGMTYVAILMGVFGVLALVLSSIGVYRSEEHTSELQSLRHLVCRL